MKVHTVWCNFSGEAAGEIWPCSLLGVKGLRVAHQSPTGDLETFISDPALNFYHVIKCACVEMHFYYFPRYKVDNSAISKQLPTLILFEGGKETKRKPFVNTKAVIIPYTFSEVSLGVWRVGSVMLHGYETLLEVERKWLRSLDTFFPFYANVAGLGCSSTQQSTYGGYDGRFPSWILIKDHTKYVGLYPASRGSSPWESSWASPQGEEALLAG